MLRIKIKGKINENYFKNIITLKIMSKAIANRIGIKKAKAEQIAELIMDMFGYDNRIIDNILNPEDRQLLYMLQSEGLISTGREEQRLHDGREWLTHYWELNKVVIIRYANNLHKNKMRSNEYRFEKNNKNINIYSTLTEDMWINRKNSIDKTVS
jgi:hypothetical protein